MSDAPPDTDSVAEQLTALRAAQLELVWPAAKTAAQSGDHADLVELIKIYTAMQAIDFALSHRPDPNAATRRKPGF